mmetsp:Transcript_24514/g.53090  ORF Transcript_24514/g.53090 Transcript_24514/m.53090 type:complete len:269 (+) Transcript_24514:1438-2244(+)
MHRPVQKSVKGLERIRMYPTRRIYSTPAPRRTEVTSASYSSRESPLEEMNLVVTVTPRAFPLSRMGAELLLLTTATISALIESLEQASMTGIRAVPLVDPRTPMRSFLLIAPFAISVLLCINPSPFSPTKLSLPTALYDASRASFRFEPIPVTARTRPPEHLLTSPSSLVPAWYTLTPAIAFASGRPVISMPLGYFSGYPLAAQTTVAADVFSLKRTSTESRLPSQQATKTSYKSVSRRGNTTCVSGSPKRQLYSSIEGPLGVSIIPA